DMAGFRARSGPAAAAVIEVRRYLAQGGARVGLLEVAVVARLAAVRHAVAAARHAAARPARVGRMAVAAAVVALLCSVDHAIAADPVGPRHHAEVVDRPAAELQALVGLELERYLHRAAVDVLAQRHV